MRTEKTRSKLGKIIICILDLFFSFSLSLSLSLPLSLHVCVCVSRAHTTHGFRDCLILDKRSIAGEYRDADGCRHHSDRLDAQSDPDEDTGLGGGSCVRCSSVEGQIVCVCVCVCVCTYAPCQANVFGRLSADSLPVI